MPMDVIVLEPWVKGLRYNSGRNILRCINNMSHCVRLANSNLETSLTIVQMESIFTISVHRKHGGQKLSLNI